MLKIILFIISLFMTFSERVEGGSGPCDSYPCLNGGTCITKRNGDFRCKCVFPNEGTTCDRLPACDKERIPCGGFNPCDGARCPRHPKAQCYVSNCGRCHAVFHKNNKVKNCKKQKKNCKCKKHGQCIPCECSRPDYARTYNLRCNPEPSSNRPIYCRFAWARTWTSCIPYYQ